MGKRARIHGSVLRARPLEEKADRRAAGREGRAAGLRVRRPVGPGRGDASRWTSVGDAYERFKAGGKLGKIVLEM